MSATKDTAPTGSAPVEPVEWHPNVLTISGLREIADWLEAHPEIPAMRAYVHGRADYSIDSGLDHLENPREALTRFAEALDCRVEEGVSYTDVRLERKINPRASIALSASMGSIGGQQRTPEYDYTPITETCSACDGKPLDPPPAWHHSFPPVCPMCNGTQTQLRAA